MMGVEGCATKARDGFVKALRAAHRWLDELLSDPTQSIESLAVREGKSERSIRMMLSLAFLSPVLALVARFSQIDGYRCLSLMRASGVVKRQLALA